MIKRLTSIFLFVATVGAGPACAADMAVKKAPRMVSAPYSWTGFYLGANGGYGWDPTTVYFDPGSFGATIFPAFAPTSGAPVSFSVRPRGLLGGVHTGYNWQASAWVYGLEADFDAAHMNGSTAAPFSVVGKEAGDAAAINGNLGLTQKIDSLGTIRGRFGWTGDNALFYVTGGAGWAHVRTTLNTFNVSASGFNPGAASLALLTATSSDVRWGAAVGAGVEFAVAQNWIAGAEYLLIDISSSPSLVFPGASTSGNLPIQTARVRLSYLFH